MIKIFNRKTKEYEMEKVAGGGLLNALYGTRTGRLGLELLIKRKFYSALTGAICDSRLSASKVKSFIRDFEIDMSECADKAEDFKTFNEFFTRRLKPEARVFQKEGSAVLSPGDGRLKAWENVNIDQLLQIKGFSYTLKDLIRDEQLAAEYEGGTYLLLRLCPVDYHRFHFIDGGVCSGSKRINGAYYSVNPIALSSVPLAFCRNKREYSILASDNFGDILYVEVGATSVGSIVQTYSSGARVQKGDEKGYFKFGGSTVLVLFKKNKVRIHADILKQTEAGYETRVLAGEVIGGKMDKDR
ncbi:MAG: phosphatidylserine decarboxylase [Clostridia bacterium]|nr:phosphatidylserine decarboxylase [Clostridia bacterium]